MGVGPSEDLLDRQRRQIQLVAHPTVLFQQTRQSVSFGERAISVTEGGVDGAPGIVGGLPYAARILVRPPSAHAPSATSRKSSSLAPPPPISASVVGNPIDSQKSYTPSISSLG
jgi:hypothetical protein